MLAIPEREPSSSRWATRAALFSFGLIVSALFLHRVFAMPTPVAFNLFMVGLGAAVFSIAAAIAASVIIWATGRPGTARVLFAVCFSLGILAVPLVYLMWVRDYPRVSDVTTDFDNPPKFVKLVSERGPGDNPVGYKRKLAEEQALSYPDIKPVVVSRSSEEVFALVVDAVKHLNMDLSQVQEPSAETGTPGVIEATSRTLILGFYDDVALRISGDGETARVDIRSAARFGRGDMGRNAERVRELVKEIQLRIDSTVPGAEGARKADDEGRPESKREKGAAQKRQNRRK